MCNFIIDANDDTLFSNMQKDPKLQDCSNVKLNWPIPKKYRENEIFKKNWPTPPDEDSSKCCIIL